MEFYVTYPAWLGEKYLNTYSIITAPDLKAAQKYTWKTRNTSVQCVYPKDEFFSKFGDPPRKGIYTMVEVPYEEI